MTPLVKVSDPTLLNRSAVYQICGYLYRYLGNDPYANLQSPQFQFRPLPGQRRRADIVLNRRKMLGSVHEVPNMQLSRSATATPDYVQLGLF